MRTILILAATSSILLTFTADPVHALPLFGRKYNTTCFTCHVAAPLLNDFGERFRSNGFEMPGAGADKTALQDKETLPLALLVQPKAAHVQQTDNLTSRTTKETAFEGVELELFSAASLGGHFSYFTEIEVELENEGTGVALGMLYALYTDVLNNGSGNLNFRLGKMHMGLPLAHTSFLANGDPLIYADRPLAATVTPENDLPFAHTMFGLAAFGMFAEVAEGLHWELALTGGAKNEVNFNGAHAAFASLNQGFDLGDMRVEAGAFFFGGRQRITREGYSAYPKRNTHYRAGFDLELQDPWTNRLHLYGQYVIGSDDNVNYWGMGRKVSGGFAGLDAILFPEKLYAFGRYDFLNADDTTEKTGSQIDLGFRYHFLPNVALTAGLMQKSTKFGNLSAVPGGHGHRISPVVPTSGDDEEEPVVPGSPANTGPTAADLTATSIYLGILIGY